MNRTVMIVLLAGGLVVVGTVGLVIVGLLAFAWFAAPQAEAPAPPAGGLEGLYVGGDAQQRARWYFFKRSGAVAIDFSAAIVDPDEAAGWPVVEVYTASQAREQGYDPSGVELGTFQVMGERIRLVTQMFAVDHRRKVKFREQVYGDTFDRKGNDESFRASGDFQEVRIDELLLVRQGDQSGRWLEGEFAHEAFGAERRSGRLIFTRSGLFSLREVGEEAGSGRYEIRGNDIALLFSDGRTVTQPFGYLGRDDRGREYVALGGLIWIKGLF